MNFFDFVVWSLEQIILIMFMERVINGSWYGTFIEFIRNKNALKKH